MGAKTARQDKESKARDMELIAEYLRRAEECRKVAQQTTVASHRKAIQEICDMWARLADERRKLLARQRSKNSPD